MIEGLSVWGVTGVPEVRPGDDLATLLAAAEPGLADGDVLVVTSKAISKAEGRVRAGDRDAAVDAETVRVVARRGPTRIVETRHGLVLAAAGVDASNTEPGTLVLLPEDPDDSARRLKAGMARELGVRVAVVISDTFGRPWRYGLTDVAIGLAGMDALDDFRGHVDPHGNPLDATVTALADELAGAADLVKGKLTGVPAAVIRGLGVHVSGRDGPGARAMVRPPGEDMFRYGSRDVVHARHTTEEFSERPLDPGAVRRVLDAALDAPCVPSGDGQPPWRFALVESAPARKRLLDTVLGAQARRGVGEGRDGRGGDGTGASSGGTESGVGKRVETLRGAPCLVVPCVYREDRSERPDTSPADPRRATSLLEMGASMENLLVAAAAEGLASCWVPEVVHCAEAVHHELDLPASWEPAAVLGIGHAAAPEPARAPHDSADLVTVR